MSDIVSKEKRSLMMSGIRAKNTTPEIAVRRLLHRLGCRFRLHRKDLPGCPDIVLPKYRIVILVHGCFWHQHQGCRFAYIPKSRQEFWAKKFSENQARDTLIVAQLEALEWNVIVVWECETKDAVLLRSRLVKEMHLDGPQQEFS